MRSLTHTQTNSAIYKKQIIYEPGVRYWRERAKHFIKSLSYSAVAGYNLLGRWGGGGGGGWGEGGRGGEGRGEREGSVRPKNYFSTLNIFIMR